MKETITINVNKWITQKKYCELTGTSINNMSYMIRNNKIKSRYIAHLGMTLVEKPVNKSPL